MGFLLSTQKLMNFNSISFCITMLVPHGIGRINWAYQQPTRAQGAAGRQQGTRAH